MATTEFEFDTTAGRVAAVEQRPDRRAPSLGDGSGVRLERRRRERRSDWISVPDYIDSVLGSELRGAWSALTEADFTPRASARDALMRRVLGAVDVAGAYGALFLILGLINGARAVHPEALLIAPFVIVLSKSLGLYDRDANRVRKTTLDELPRLLYFSGVYALAVWIAQDVLLAGGLSRPQVFALVLTTCGFVAFGRALARFMVTASSSPERCIFVGPAADAARTSTKLAGSPGVKAELIGRISLHPWDQEQTTSIPVLGGVSQIAQLVKERGLERAIVTPDAHDQEAYLQVIRLLKALGVKVSVLPRLLEVVGSSSTFDDIDGLTLLGVAQYGLSKSSKFLKRAVDIAGATILFMLLAPLLGIIALAVKLDSPGPVLFRQNRIGQGGRHFQMLKFRSMFCDAEARKAALQEQNEAQGGLFKIREDPRRTRVGRLLRQISLDELPQLINVLCGHMSLVGPRPLVPDEDALVAGWQRRRLTVRPGMTGLWQIYGSARIPMPEMVKIDYLYGANWSIWLDLKILIRTIPYVLRRKGL